jgi:hypothetical protein
VPPRATGDAEVMVASLVNVTIYVPFAATVRGVGRVCAVPHVEVAKFQVTLIGVDERKPFWVVDNAEVAYPFAFTVLALRLTPVMVTGKEF